MSVSLEMASGARVAAASTPPLSSSSLPLPLALTSTTVSDEMRSLFDGQRKIHEQILRLQAQIEEEEAAYLEDTAHGNIIRGWDGFIDSKQSRKEAALKKIKPYTESEHLFSNCCFYATLAQEPSIDLADYHPKEEGSGRRRVAAATVATVAGVGRPIASPGVQKPVLERKQSFSGGRGGGGGGASTGSAPVGRPPKKKRRRLDHLEVASTASATHSETGEDDDKEPPMPTLKKSRSLGASEATATVTSAESGDFVDML